MEKEIRKQKLVELLNNPSSIEMTGIPLKYKGERKKVNVYKIPLEYLIYNKYNGRIGSTVMSYEAQNGKLDAEDANDKKLIEKFLYDSKKDRNDTTMKSLFKDRQQRYGIVTADGVIIDGNRRAMLLNRLVDKREEMKRTIKDVEHCKYFLAIILDNDATERDIQQLETIYQMGEDDKLDYNPIEKYLKCKQLKNLGFSEKDISGLMSEKPKKIEEWLSILNLMEEYLDNYEYNGIYTRLDKTEGPFVDLNSYLESYKKKGANVSNVDWLYDESDISDLKVVSFDYIRARYEGKEFRDIAKTGKEGSIFFFKEIWSQFLHEHMKLDVKEDEVKYLREKHPDEDLTKLLGARDTDWTNKVGGNLKGNLRRFSSRLDDKRDSNKPSDLLERALSALQSVDIEQDSFLNDQQVLNMVKEINAITWEMKKKLKC